MKMTNFPHFCVFLGVLLLRERCCGQSGRCLSNAASLANCALSFIFPSGNCPYRYCSHTATLSCSSGGLVSLQCVVYNTTGPIQVRWYHSQNGDPEELNITAGGRYTVEESKQSPSASSRYANCTKGDQLYWNVLNFSYSDGDSSSYWCRIVTDGDILLELSEAWTVQSITGGPAVCGPGGTASQTDPKCAGQISPILASTTLLVQSTPTSVVGATSELLNAITHGPVQTHSLVQTHSPVQTHSLVQAHSPVQTPSAFSTSSSDATGCTLGGVSCFVYLGAGLGALAVIVALLVVVVIALVHISVKIQKKKRKGER